ncbi:dienelactone hydrolase family protein [Janibacter sp. YB324]|uniref:dienelactone hydrolase family protein n=1 Tax=Janibacter sp. YB324 TaxID=2761047 RepID=UPI0016274AD9|nr:dienelactone hydrolase family protein [Janibacter sp. YB324]QNF93229.1 dienelactone hydrolase family protein [Janibacter sp. YB324]
MAHVLLLHSALGLRPGVHAFADRLREHDHEVVVPDYYEGHVFDEEAPGIAHRDAHPEYFESVRELAASLPPETVLAGFSLGAWFAQRLAARRPRARAAILLHSVAAPRHEWSGVPVQVHRHEDDPWISPADVPSLGAAVEASGAPFEDHVTPGRGHLFTDPELPGYDEAVTSATIERIDVFLR